MGRVTHHILNSQLFCSYNILSKLLDKFGLIVEHSKTDIFHFNRSHGVFNPPPLDLSAIRGPILKPKIHGNILASSSTGSSIFTNILTST